LSEVTTITPEAQFQESSVIPFPQKPELEDFEEELHRAAMFASQSRLHLCRAKRMARSTRARRVLELLISEQQQAVESVQRLRTGGRRPL
jgi:hypothetical protein